MKGGEYMDYITLPNSGQKLYSGSVVMLSRFPGTKWILCNGWYTYQGQQYNGWYFSSIPAQTTLPISNEDLNLLTVINNGGSGNSYNPSCGCPPVYPGPCPPPEMPEPFTKSRALQLDRAWISVGTITERDKLSKGTRTDGKIVRVDETPDGTPAYYRWDAAKNDWVTETFGIDTSQFATKDEINDLISESLNSDEFTSKIEDIVSSSSSIQDSIDKQIQDMVPDMISDEVSKATESLNQDIQTINNNLTQVTNNVQSVQNDVDYIKTNIPEWNQLT